MTEDKGIMVIQEPRRRKGYYRNINRAFEAAVKNDAIREEGALWYDMAQDWCFTTARDFGCSMPTVAAVLAVLSPMTEWEINKRDTRKLLEAFAAGHRVPPMTSGWRRNREKAWRYLNGEWPLSARRANRDAKVLAFYSNIVRPNDPDNRVVLDRHAIDIAFGRRQAQHTMSAGLYSELEHAYKSVAKHQSKRPNVVQATTWLWWRQKIKLEAVGEEVPF